MEDSNNITQSENIEEVEEVSALTVEENIPRDLPPREDAQNEYISDEDIFEEVKPGAFDESAFFESEKDAPADTQPDAPAESYAKVSAEASSEIISDDALQNDAPEITDFSKNITSGANDNLFYYEEDRTEEINKYTKFKKVDGATYRKVNLFLRKRTYITAREWAIARLCSDFKTPYGSEMTFIGNHLPELCPFMEEPYSAQAVNQARTSFKRKVRKSGATFFYGAMCGFFTPDELDDILFESSEIAKFLLEIEGTNLEIDDEIDIEDKISDIMRRLGESANIMLSSRRGGSSDAGDDEDVVEVEVYGGKEDAGEDVKEEEVKEGEFDGVTDGDKNGLLGE